MVSLCQAYSSTWATPVLLAKRVFSLASSPFGHKISRHYSSFRAFNSASTSVCLDSKELRSTDLVDLEYAELNLKYKISEEVGHVRIRQHVNPLSSSFSKPAPVPAWDEVYKDPSLPLMVDIGSGSGRFLLWLAKKNIDSRNYLGLEIRQKLVKRANFWVNELRLSNIHFIFANAMVSFEQLISSYPGPLEFVSILCPDPHFKKRHQKRRVVQKPLVNSIVQNLIPGGKIFVQSDVLEVAQDMRDQLDEESNVLQHMESVDTEEGWLIENPMGIRTEREIHAEFEGARIYRRLYQKLELTT
ncbi:trna (guanine-n -)-methyltransferase-like [Arabis alpina]|uniref:tRNA (guanine(46)-N(7))-methyltransferase n=1 Tax=Arabis alpina TaxID=50452 RepID=A0A087G7Y8_ARAAL|nr:trna (guanine-n -)-methyltransferase-like [Arabis alpina]